MKKHFFCLIIIISTTSFSQTVRGFGGFGIYLDRSFDKSGFASLNGGLEFKVNKILKPEIEFEYFIGALPDRTTEDLDGVTTELLVRTVYATNMSITSKISFGNEDDDVHFQILPIYNITNVVAKGSLFTLNNTKTDLIKTDSDKFSETKHSLGIGIGVLFDLSDESFQSIAINLYYNNIDIGSALTKLKFNKGTYQTQQSLGFGVQYYFGFSKKKNKK